MIRSVRSGQPAVGPLRPGKGPRRFSAGHPAVGRAALFSAVLLIIPAALAYLLARTVGRGAVAVFRQDGRPRSRTPGLPFTVRLQAGTRRAAGWGRRRLAVVLSALCVMSLVAGVAVAVAGVGKPRPIVIPPQTVAGNRALATAWIAQQVSPAATVSCDPVMCRQVRRSGFPPARLKIAAPAAGDPLSSGVIIATPEIRRQFGARLAAVDAPLVIAGFGTGAERVDVRAVAPHGAPAFRLWLASEHAALVSAAQQLLRNGNIQVRPIARAALLDGRVDPRLLITLAALASEMPVRLVAFDDVSPGANPDVPLRGAEIGVGSPAGQSQALAFLHAQQAPYLPAVAGAARSTSDQPLVTVRYDTQGLTAIGGL